MSRTANQLQLRVVKPGASRIHGDIVKGLTGDEWEPGFILTLTNTGAAATLASTIASTSAGPVKFVALNAFDGTANTFVSLEELAADTVLEAQLTSGTAVQANIGRRGVLVQDATTGHYSVTLTDTNPSVEIVDVEPVFAPWSKEADNERNLVWFKFLPALLEKAPAAPAS
jgi:hypothetical protein